jgi:hypothetical protein
MENNQKFYGALKESFSSIDMERNFFGRLSTPVGGKQSIQLILEIYLGGTRQETVVFSKPFDGPVNGNITETVIKLMKGEFRNEN